MATDNSERIDNFLREQMTPEENEAFLHDMETDEALRQEVLLTAQMIQQLHERQVRDDDDIIAEVVATRKTARRARIIRMVKWLGSVAAMLFLVFGIWLYQSAPSGGIDYIALADKYYTETSAPTYRSGLTDADEELADLFEQVGTSGDMSAVISRLQAIYDDIDSEYAYRVDGNDVRIAWHLALAYLKDNQPHKATKLLRTITTDDKGTDLGTKAQRLLHDIKHSLPLDDKTLP